MANNLIYVDDLNAKKDFVNMKMRIIRRWLHNSKIEMILINERGKKIHGTVKKDLIPQFGDILKEDDAVLINRCGVALYDDLYPVVKNTYKLNFYKSTTVTAAHSFLGHPYGFSFVPFNEITPAMAQDKNILNVDVIGSVTWCGNLDIYKSAKGKETKRFNFHMTDADGRLLKCTMWGDYAVQFNNFVEKNNSPEHVIAIIQHALVKEWKNNVTVQSDMFATRMFINEDLNEARDLRRRFILRDGNATPTNSLSSQTVYPNRLEFLLNTERKFIDEVLESDTAMDCVVLGTIALLEQEFGWFYIGCRKCNKKVINKQEFLEGFDIEDVSDDVINAPIDSLWCPKEKARATDLVPKFRVTFRVQDSTGSASFLMFDRDITRLIGLSATDIRERQFKSDDDQGFPHELNALLNKKLAFKIAISSYNLEKKYTVFTVVKVCDDPDVISELSAKDNTIEANEDSHNAEISGVKLSESSQCGVSSKDAFSVTSESLPTDLEKDTETSPLPKRQLILTPGVESANHAPRKMRKINIAKLS